MRVSWAGWPFADVGVVVVGLGWVALFNLPQAKEMLAELYI